MFTVITAMLCTVREEYIMSILASCRFVKLMSYQNLLSCPADFPSHSQSSARAVDTQTHKPKDQFLHPSSKSSHFPSKPNTSFNSFTST